MTSDEAIEALKALDPRLLVAFAEFCESAAAAKLANDQENAWRRMENAIVTLMKVSGADDELLKSQIAEGHDAAAATSDRVTRAALDNANLRFADGGLAFIQAAFARHLVSLPIGIAGTAAGLAAVGSLEVARDGRKPWLFERAKRPGGDNSVGAEVERLVINGVLAEAARLVVHSELSRRKAIIKAVATHGARAIDRGLRIDPELLRVRSSRRAIGDKPADELNIYFEQRLEYERDMKFQRPRPPLESCVDLPLATQLLAMLTSPTFENVRRTMPSTQSKPVFRLAFRDMSEANRGGAFTPIDGALENGGVNALLHNLRDGLEITVYGAGDDFLVNVSEWRLAHDLLDNKRRVNAARPMETA